MSPGATRRRFLEAAGATTAAAWLGPVVRAAASARVDGDVVGTLPFVGEGSFPLETTVGDGLGRRRALDLSTLSPASSIVPQERFFIRTACPDTLPDTRSWKLRVRGLVEAPSEIDASALLRESADLGVHLLECAGNSRAAHFGFMSAARWAGVALAQVLDRVRPQPRATRVLVSGFDRHAVQDPTSVPGASWVFGLDDVRRSGAFLATQMNGAPLSPDHGAPLRLVVPGWYGCTAIKWVNEIALVDDDAPATDQMREYAGRTHQPPAGRRDEELIEQGRRPEGPRLARDFQPATVDPAAVPVRVDMLRRESALAYRIVGVLWGAGATVSALGIRLDPQGPLAPVEEMAGGTPGAWTFWSYTFRPEKRPGRRRIELALRDRAVRTRRLDVGYYAREIEVARV